MNARTPHQPTVRSILSLGWPMLVSQLAVMANGIIDTAMAGNRSAFDLASVAIGSSIYFVVYVGLMGALQSISPMAAQHYGGDRPHAVGETWRQGQWMALILLVPGAIALAFPQPFLSLAGASPEVTGAATRYLNLVALGLPAALWFRAFTTFNAAVSRPRTVMVINLLGPICKIPLNLLFMNGSDVPAAFGLPAVPALGGSGCGLSTSVIACVSAAIGWIILRRDPFYRRFALHGIGRPNGATLRELLRLGLPIGGTYLIDVSAFQLMTLLVARLGTEVVGGHAIASNLAAVIFMLPLSMGNATSVLAAQALGAADPVGARRTAWLGIRLGFAMAIGMAVVLWLVKTPLAAAYTKDPAVAGIAASLLTLVAFYHLFDAMQCVLAFVLRAWKIAVAPMLVFAASLWGIGVGGGWWLAFGLGWGVKGFWIAAAASVAAASAGLLVIFMRHTRDSIDATPAAPAASR
jgi:MATE family multidrug resistance protein